MNINTSIIIISDRLYGVVCCVVVSGNVRTEKRKGKVPLGDERIRGLIDPVFRGSLFDRHRHRHSLLGDYR